jgi:DNA-binding response OmpR family regulator
MSRILLIEDNADLAFGLRNNLEIEGYEVDVAGDGSDGLSRARRGEADLVILDLMLPGTDGFRILRALREEGMAAPVLILTARDEEADKVRGLTSRSTARRGRCRRGASPLSSPRKSTSC